MSKNNLLFFSFIFCVAICTAQVSVTMQHNDLSRSGWNRRETVLTPLNVNATQFGKLFSVAIDDQLYAQPLVIANVNIGSASHNVVYVATVNNTVYAIDGDSGTVYWTKNYTPSGQRPPKNSDMTGACGGNYKDFSGNMGIVGTPVIDSAAQTIYFVARSTNGSGAYYQYIHAVDIKTGNERVNSPFLINASVSGNGDGSINGIINFNAQRQNQRQALTLYNGTLIITFASHCDWGPYHGWVLGYDANTLQQKYVYNTTPEGYNAGIWQSGGGPSVDANGNIYLVTGNGSVGYNSDVSNLTNRGESALRLTPSGSTLSITSFFTPNNFQNLENADLDYGGMGAFLVPNTNLYFTGCKDGNLYLLNKDTMGSYKASGNKVVQTIALGANITLRCQPSYYRSSAKEFIYVWSENSQLKAFPFSRSTNKLDVANLITGTAQGPTGANGAVLSTSSNDLTNGTGILWASFAKTGDANQSVRPGILRAFDANDVTKEIWNSGQNSTRDDPGNYAKFSAPTIANGKVYLPTFSNQLVVYGLLDTAGQIYTCISGTNLALNKPAYSSSNESAAYPPSLAFDGNSITRWSSAYGDPQWIYVDLGQIDSICNISLSWETALGKDFQLQVSNDAINWNTVSNITGNTSFTNSINLNTTGRFVRMYGTERGTPYGYSLYEFQVYGKLADVCPAPSGVTVNSIDTSSAVVRWSYSGAASYNVQVKPSSSNVWQTYITTADSLKITGLTCGNYFSYQVQAVCDVLHSSQYSAPGTFNTLACTNCGFLPTRYYTSDIGNIGIGGQACFTSPDIFNVQGSGDDIWNNADAFRYVYKTFSGDGKMDVKITSQDQTNQWNKAGVMFRESLDAGSRHAFMAITSGNGTAFQYRNATNGTSANVNQPGFTAPYFVRLSKKGTTYTGYRSADGINWTLQSSIDIAGMGLNGAPLYAGMAVTSHDNTKLSKVLFNQFAITFDTICGALPAGVITADIGQPSLAGTTCYNSPNNYNIKGSGNVSNTADSFRFVYKTFTGDLSMDVKVTTQDSANSLNKAGLMLRASLKSGSPNVFIALTSLKGAVFQYRTVENGITSLIKKGTYKAPYFLRIKKSGNRYTGYVSADSVTWIKIGSLGAPVIADTIYAGLAVTSSTNKKLSTAIFDNWQTTGTPALKQPEYVSNKSIAAERKAASVLNLNIYPNPAKAGFTVDFAVIAKQNVLLAIIGAGDGRVYYTENLVNFSGNYHKEFSKVSIPNGSYIVSLRTKDGIKNTLLVKE